MTILERIRKRNEDFGKFIASIRLDQLWKKSFPPPWLEMRTRVSKIENKRKTCPREHTLNAKGFRCPFRDLCAPLPPPHLNLN